MGISDDRNDLECLKLTFNIFRQKQLPYNNWRAYDTLAIITWQHNLCFRRRILLGINPCKDALAGKIMCMECAFKVESCYLVKQPFSQANLKINRPRLQ